MDPSSREPVVGMPSPIRHLITLIADALSLPGPTPDSEHERAYLRLVSRRAALAMSAARTALASDSDAGAIRAARDLFGAVADEPATSYQHAVQAEAPGGAL
jgi:CO/xanthine dehydrogenase FAD-binding subunit